MEMFYAPLGPYQTNCYVLVNGGRAAVIDPGLGAAEMVARLSSEHDFTVERVVLTHGHIDHTRDAGEIAARYGLPVYLHPADKFMVEQPGEGTSAETARAFNAADMAPLQNLEPLNHGDVIDLVGMQCEVRHAPGHSPGCVLLVGDEVVFSGDVLFAGSIGRTDLADSSPQEMVRSLKEQVLTLDDSLGVLPGHGPATSMRAERRTNPYLRDPDAIA
ncbi:hypothetical protein C1Y63_03720 [Corynebacterium sp. 13CS0277]|uniref:MBL fold metallo-hydrolase n=1 Tax=Corynebacterium sp. 13CS0277 TaxID=2071994 RepID=UPI000D022ED3|nr:MBL fold metallo-hydrolase [Corynebacterium sp. 13CS0277]PRQ11971.1 hypothetical protein C1Y63_03720 [Corynebacterium sp. 13CS0277]